jgi:hypothetical protein
MAIAEGAFALLLVALGLLLWGLAARDWIMRRAMRRWPTVPGVVRAGRSR